MSSDNIRSLLESLNNIIEQPVKESDIPNEVMDRVKEALELAIDTIIRRRQVTEETFNFTVEKLDETLNMIDSHNTVKSEVSEIAKIQKKSPYEQGAADAYYGRWNIKQYDNEADRKEYAKGHASENERKDWGE